MIITDQNQKELFPNNEIEIYSNRTNLIYGGIKAFNTKSKIAEFYAFNEFGNSLIDEDDILITVKIKRTDLIIRDKNTKEVLA